MSFAHRIYITVMVVLVAAVFVYLLATGISYYRVTSEERFFHHDHASLKPSGPWGHGMGIAGSLLMLMGMGLYIARKRLRSMSRLGLLRHWLEFHIFLCTLGPLLILFHTAFKFGGLVAISFWSMVAVFVSGIVGRFIYIQIPRTIEGRELSLGEVKAMKGDLLGILRDQYHLDEVDYNIIVESTRRKAGLVYGNFLQEMTRKYIEDRKTLTKVKYVLKKTAPSGREYKKMLRFVKNELSLNRRIGRLTTMQNLFRYWHVAHLPFAFVMIIIMIIHVGVTLVFGYRWIF